MNERSTESLAIIGNRIKKQREFLGYTREQLAEMAGISSRSIAYLEDGEREMGIITLMNICQALDISSDYLLFNKENSDIKSIAGLLNNCKPEKLKHIEMIIRVCKEM